MFPFLKKKSFSSGVALFSLAGPKEVEDILAVANESIADKTPGDYFLKAFKRASLSWPSLMSFVRFQRGTLCIYFIVTCFFFLILSVTLIKNKKNSP